MKKTLMVAVPLMVLIAGGVGFWKYRTRDYVDPLKVEREERTAQSLKVISKGMDQEPNLLYRSMVNVALEVDPATLAKIQAFEVSKVPLVRAGVAYVLAAQNDVKSAETIARLAQDPESMVRSHLINGCRMAPAADKEKILNLLLKNKNITDIEKYEAMAVLYSISKDARESEKILDELLAAAQKESKSRIGDFLILQLNSIAPENKKVLALDQRALTASNPAVVAAAIRALAARKDAAVVANFSKYIHSPESAVKRAAVENMHLICPANRWQWIAEGYESDQDFASRSVWILAAERVRGAEAKDFFAHALEAAEKNGRRSEAGALQAAMKRLQAYQGEEPCKR